MPPGPVSLRRWHNPGPHRAEKGSPSTMAKKANNPQALLGYEAQLWQMADALRGSMGEAEYKQLMLVPRRATRASSCSSSRNSEAWTCAPTRFRASNSANTTAKLGSTNSSPRP